MPTNLTSGRRFLQHKCALRTPWDGTPCGPQSRRCLVRPVRLGPCPGRSLCHRHSLCVGPPTPSTVAVGREMFMTARGRSAAWWRRCCITMHATTATQCMQLCNTGHHFPSAMPRPACTCAPRHPQTTWHTVTPAIRTARQQIVATTPIHLHPTTPLKPRVYCTPAADAPPRS